MSAPSTVVEAAGARWLALLPLLVATGGAVDAAGLGVAALAATVAATAMTAALRRFTGDDVAWPGLALVIAAVVAAVDLAMRAFFPVLHAAIGTFVPLVAIACAPTVRAAASAAETGAVRAGLAAVLAGFVALTLLGALREGFGDGVLFAGAGAALGLPGIELRLAGVRGLVAAALPVGAFVGLAGLVALARRHGASR